MERLILDNPQYQWGHFPGCSRVVGGKFHFVRLDGCISLSYFEARLASSTK
jgi:hypothetical protein